MKKLLLILLSATILYSCDTQKKSKVNSSNPSEKLISKIAFGSCANQNKPLPILDITDKYNPDLFIFLGDNIYGDTRDMDVLEDKYHKLGQKSEFIRLKSKTEILATWDDHDYGENDAGRYYPFKKESKEIFMNFWYGSKYLDVRKRDGIYHSVFYGIGKNAIQVILLDTRTFRDNLTYNNNSEGYKNDYKPCMAKDSTLLGATQWQWLKSELKKEAGLRIIASSIQFAHEYNGWESWTNFPHEKEKLFSVVKETKAEGVIFISGDVHWGEVSLNKPEGIYPIYDATSSGLTQNWHNTENNKNRVGEVVRENNFGLIEIERSSKGQIDTISIKLIDINGVERVVKKVAMSELEFGN